MRSKPSPSPRPARAGERGLTIIEALIAMALLLLVAIGILPLFTRAMVNNAAGSEATQTANHARGRLEDMTQLSFNNVALRIDSGSELLTEDAYFTGVPLQQGDEHWEAPGSGSGMVLYERTTRVRQYSIHTPIDSNADNIIDGFGGLADSGEDGVFDNPLPAGTGSQFIHLKEVAVEIVSPRGEDGNAGPLGAAPTYQVRTLKAF